MELVLLTALGVGGATVFGAIIGFAFKNISHKFTDIVMSFAAGIMLGGFGIYLLARPEATVTDETRSLFPGVERGEIASVTKS